MTNMKFVIQSNRNIENSNIDNHVLFNQFYRFKSHVLIDDEINVTTMNHHTVKIVFKTNKQIS